jgi:hypothetical protein
MNLEKSRIGLRRLNETFKKSRETLCVFTKP